MLAEYASSQIGAIKAIGYLLQGTIGALPPKFSFGPIKTDIAEVLKLLHDNCLDQINFEICGALIGTLNRLISSIASKSSKNGDVSPLAENEEILFNLLITCYAFLNSTETEAAKCKPLVLQIGSTVELIDKVLLRGEGKFMIRNTQSLVAKLLAKDYGNVTKHSMELKQILLVFQVTTGDELKAGVKLEEKEVSIEECGYMLAEKISKQSKDKEVIMKVINLIEVFIAKYKEDVHLISERVVSALRAAFAADIDAKAIVILRRRILRLQNSMRKLHKRPLPMQLVKSYLETSTKMLAMPVKEIDFRKESMQFLVSVCEELFDGEGKSAVFAEYPEMKQVTEICIDELWNKDEDMRLFASKCVPVIVGHYPFQTAEAGQFADEQLIDISISNKKPKEIMERVTALVKAEEAVSKELIGDFTGVLDKLISFAIDEGGAPRDNIILTLKSLMKRKSIYILKEYLVSINQGFLMRSQFLKQLIKESILMKS